MQRNVLRLPEVLPEREADGNGQRSTVLQRTRDALERAVVRADIHEHPPVEHLLEKHALLPQPRGNTLRKLLVVGRAARGDRNLVEAAIVRASGGGGGGRGGGGGGGGGAGGGCSSGNLKGN